MILAVVRKNDLKWGALGLAILCMMGVAACLIWGNKEQEPISPIGGIAEGTFHFSLLPIFRQNDPRWAQEEIGGSKEPLREVGCIVSSMSMALAHYGIELFPDQLNSELKAKHGYTKKGWIKWNAITEITKQAITIEIPRVLNHVVIDSALKANQPVIAKVYLHGIIPHWILIVGKTEQEYLIKDPLGRINDLEKLSKFGSDIYAIRIVRRTKETAL